jgi:hypothetical protein
MKEIKMSNNLEESVKASYLKLGKTTEQLRIIRLIESIMENHQPASEEFDVLNDLVATIKNDIAPCIWCGLKEMDVFASCNGKDICINCEEKTVEGKINE